jgi:CheY-like chemotaxis protein
MSRPPAPSASRPGRHRRAPCFGADLAGITVLVVDDDADARDLIERLLADCNARVTVAASAGEALQLLPAVRPDVLLSDIGMTGMDGYDFIKRVRTDYADGLRLPAAAITAFARPDDRRRALLAGYQTHLPKPIEPAELVAVVATLAGRAAHAAVAPTPPPDPART